MRRTDELTEKLIASGKCPVDAIVRLAERAEAEGDLSQAIGAWKSVLPYVYPKPKPVEVDPEQVVELERALAEVQREAKQPPMNSDIVALAEARAKELEELRQADKQHRSVT